ncbi:hypothetical protein F4805DRAFT_473192 [Annulohypoxylon moriforme]|nr:hypothetical protein F4805DRAFT_473192 [Annulohypoxylon moriforme]
MVAIDLFEAQVEAQVDEYLKRESRYLPRSSTYNWRPFLRALSEGNMATGEINTIRSGMTNNRFYPFPMQRDGPIPPPVQAIPKMPSSGSWDYTCYVPEWSHPEFDPGTVNYFTREVRHISNRDPINRVYPALRAVDQVKGATEFARHFGIHPDEPGGRSRLSPTLAPTRNPFDHLAAQISTLSPDARQALIDASRQAAIQRGFVPDDPNYIDPDVLDTTLAQNNVLSGAILKQNLTTMLLQKPGELDDVSNLDTFVKALNEQSPETVKFHNNFLENALHDQDYQRFIFNGLTSDELIVNDYFSLVENPSCDLEVPFLHPHRWSNNDWKGTKPREPRVLYSTGGQRHEWNVHTNDELWDALQPALKLVTKILNSGHPMFNIMPDLTNRQYISRNRDNRSKRGTPYLWSFNDTRTENLFYAPPGVKELDDAGFDWVKEVWYIINNKLMIDISSGFLKVMETSDDDLKVRENQGFSYGMTTSLKAGPDASLYICLSAELLWPLLVPSYSGSEKMVTSFQIAVSLIHELGHAMIQSHWLLTTDREYLKSRGFDEWTIGQLMRMQHALFDYDNGVPENFYKDRVVNECGFELEKAILGDPIMNLMQDELVHSRQTQTIPYIATSNRFPFYQPAGLPSDEIIRGAQHPVVDYISPVPIAHMAKFFTNAFWSTDFSLYGLEALKFVTDGLAFKRLTSTDTLEDEDGTEAFGDDDFHFLSHTINLLSTNEHATLSNYVRVCMIAAMRPKVCLKRWTGEMERWRAGWMVDIDEDVLRMRELVNEAREALRVYAEVQQGQTKVWQDYVVRTQGSGLIPMSLQDWKTDFLTRLNGYFSHGGLLMRQYAAVYKGVMEEVRHMQNMIFDCFNNHPDARRPMEGLGHVTRGWQLLAPIRIAHARLVKERQMVRFFYTTILSVSQINELAADLKARWQEWGAKYQSCWRLLDELVQMLEGPPPLGSDDTAWKKRFASVPSSYWKSTLDRVQVLAHREYLRVDPRIRQVIDDCMALIRQHQDNLTQSLVVPGVESLTQAMQAIEGGVPPPPDPGAGMFTWTPPSTEPVKSAFDLTGPGPIIVWPHAKAGGPTDTGGAVYGQLGQIGPTSQLGAAPLRRTDGPQNDGGGGVFGDWAGKGGFAGNVQGPAQASFGTGGTFVVPPTTTGGSRFSGALFPTPGADAITLTSDVQHYLKELAANPKGTGKAKASDTATATASAKEPAKKSGPYKSIESYRDGNATFDADEEDPELLPLYVPESLAKTGAQSLLGVRKTDPKHERLSDILGLSENVNQPSGVGGSGDDEVNFDDWLNSP